MIFVCLLQDPWGRIVGHTCESALPRKYSTCMPGHSEMETQEENSQNQIMLALLASEPAQAPADDPSLYHMDFTISCAIRFNHVSEAKHLGRFAQPSHQDA